MDDMSEHESRNAQKIAMISQNVKEVVEAGYKDPSDLLSKTTEITREHDWTVRVPGKVVEFKNGPGSFILHPVPHTTPEAIWFLAQETDGIEALHEIAKGYLVGLVEQAYSKTKNIYDEKEATIANLALIQLSELHEQGKYDSEKTLELVGLVDQIVERENELLEPYFPPFWGIKPFWTEALKDKNTAAKAWEVVNKATANYIPPYPPYSDYLHSLNMPLYEAANLQEKIPSELVNQLSDFFNNEKLMQGNYADLHPDVFLSVVRKKLTNRAWLLVNPGDLQRSFRQEGMATDVFNIVKENPKRHFPEGFRMIYKGSPWIQEAEFQILVKSITALKKDEKLVLGYDEAKSCIDSWKLLEGDKFRYLELIQMFGADYLTKIDSGVVRFGEEIPNDLKLLSQIYEEAGLPPSNPEQRKGVVWLPMVGEKLMDNIRGRSVSFAGNLIIEVQSLANEVRSQNLDALLSKIHQHIHISEMREASVYIEDIYRCLEGETDEVNGVSRIEIQKLMENPDAKSRMDLIRNQTNPTLSAGEYVDRLQMGLNLSRRASQEKQLYEKPAIENLFQEVQKDLEKGFSPNLVIEIVDRLDKYQGKGKGYAFPLVLSARSYLLDIGVVPPEGINPEVWKETIIKLAGMTGEISPEVLYVWKRKGSNASKAILAQCREDYKQISQVQESLRNQGYIEENTQTIYRDITSRSMTDLVYRSLS